MPTPVPQPFIEEHVLGDLDGDVALIQYGDYRCPRCAAVQPVVAAILLRHPVRLRFIYRHFPLGRSDSMAMLAAETAEYAGMYQRFWPMHAALMANSHRISLALLFELGRQHFLPESRLRDALAIGLCAIRVQRDIVRAMLDEVESTPAFFINGRPVGNAGDEATLDAAIDAALTPASRPTLHLQLEGERSGRR